MADSDVPSHQAHRLAVGGNKLLAITSPADLQILAAEGSWQSFVRGDVLTHANQQAADAYFIEQGIASVVRPQDGTRATEICLIGPEGFTGMAIVQADGQSPYETFVQSETLRAFCIRADLINDLVDNSREFRRTLLGAIHVQTVQISENLVSAAWQRTTVRLARWLLMYHNRVGSLQLAVTHEFMALMVGAQRTKVTAALHEIEAAGAIAAVRSRVIIRDASVLENLADGTYGCAENEARRLLDGLTPIGA